MKSAWNRALGVVVLLGIACHPQSAPSSPVTPEAVAGPVAEAPKAGVDQSEAEKRERLRCKVGISAEEQQRAERAADARELLSEAAKLRDAEPSRCADALEVVRVVISSLGAGDEAALLVALELKEQCQRTLGDEEGARVTSEARASLRPQVEELRCTNGAPSPPNLAELPQSGRGKDYLKGDRLLLRASQLLDEKVDAPGARVLAQLALSYADRAESVELRAEALVTLGSSEVWMGRTEDAMKHAQEAHTLLVRIHGAGSDQLGGVYWLLGVCEQARGNPQAAFAWFKKYVGEYGPHNSGSFCERVDLTFARQCEAGYAPACAECDRQAARAGCGDAARCRVP